MTTEQTTKLYERNSKEYLSSTILYQINNAYDNNDLIKVTAWEHNRKVIVKGFVFRRKKLKWKLVCENYADCDNMNIENIVAATQETINELVAILT